MLGVPFRRCCDTVALRQCNVQILIQSIYESVGDRIRCISASQEKRFIANLSPEMFHSISFLPCIFLLACYLLSRHLRHLELSIQTDIVNTSVPVSREVLLSSCKNAHFRSPKRHRKISRFSRLSSQARSPPSSLGQFRPDQSTSIFRGPSNIYRCANEKGMIIRLCASAREKAQKRSQCSLVHPTCQRGVQEVTKGLSLEVRSTSRNFVRA